MGIAVKNYRFDESLNTHLVLDLSFAGQMSIWGIRLLAGGHRTDFDVSETLIKGFKKCNATRAGSNLLFLMDIVFGGLTREFKINCSCNPCLTKDEAKLLDLFSINQKRDDVGSNIKSLEFLTDLANRNALPLFKDYAIALRDAGLILTINKKANSVHKVVLHTSEVSTQLH